MLSFVVCFYKLKFSIVVSLNSLEVFYVLDNWFYVLEKFLFFEGNKSNI